MSVQGVLFDLGGTLMFQAYEPEKARMVAHMASQAAPLLRAWDAPPDVDLRALLSDLFDAVTEAQHARRAAGLEVDGPFIARGALAAYGIEAAAEQAEAFFKAIALGPEVWGWQTYPDTLDTLRRLRALPVRTGIVSNGWYTSDVQRRRVAEVGISEDLYDAFVTSADVMRPKPRPEVFERALGALGVGPRETVIVGDDLECDVRGAKALGMTTVWKLNGRQEVAAPEEADFAVHDLWEVFGLGLLPDVVEATLPQESLTPHEDDNAGRY